MKARRLKALGFALLGSLALLFAGCGQQAGGGTGNGAVTSVGIQLPASPPGGYNGVINVDVTVNEGARVRRIVLKVDGQQVSQIEAAGLRPQGITYTLLLDTTQLDPATKQPRFRNGTHTLTVEVTDANNNTRSASTTVIFRNQDYVRGVEVSQPDNPRAPVTVSGTQWYGNGDVFVTVDIVNYSGATYSLSGSGTSFNLRASGGQGGSLSGYMVTLTGTPTNPNATTVSGQPQLKLAKANNDGDVFEVTVEVEDSGGDTVASETFGLDNEAPNAPSGTTVQLRRVLFNYNFVNLTGTVEGTSQTLFRGTGADDGSGVGGVIYRVAFRVGSSTITTAILPDSPSPGVTVSGLSNLGTYNVVITAVEDALGNKHTATITPGSFRLIDIPIALRNVEVTTTSPDAGTGGTFSVSFDYEGGFGTVNARVALKLGNRLVDFHGTSGVPAYFGAQYVLYAFDSVGNFAVADLPVTVSQSATDRTPPTITVSLPSSVAPSSGFNVSGTYSDSSLPPSNNVRIYRSHGSLGGFEWYLTTPVSAPVSDGNYGPIASGGAPNYVGPLGVVVYGLDFHNNLGFATGTVNVQQP
jgi:hypothetical protein